MSDIETTHELVKPAGDYAPCPSDIGNASAPDAGVTPAEAPADVTPAEVAPAEAEADAGSTIALHAGSTPPPTSNAGSFMHMGQPDTVRPQHVASNLTAENKVFAFGTIGYDFTNETNRDYFQQAMHPLGEMVEAFKPMIPENEISMARFLAYRDPVTGMQVNMDKSTALTWTLKVDGIPIYAIRPQNQFAMLEFGQLLNFMIGQTGVDESKIADHDTSTTDLMSARNDSDKDKLDKTVDRVSIAGHIVGETRLYNGHVVPVLSPILRGMFSWNTRALCEAALANTKGKTKKEVDEAKDGLHNFLERVYYELRNKGVEPYHRAMNFSATNAQQASEVFLDAIAQNLQLDTISVERSPISRPGSDFWDVVMQFFDPHKRDQEARMMYRYTIDVSGLMPVTFGPLRKWRAY